MLVETTTGRRVHILMNTCRLDIISEYGKDDNSLFDLSAIAVTANGQERVSIMYEGVWGKAEYHKLYERCVFMLAELNPKAVHEQIRVNPVRWG